MDAEDLRLAVYRAFAETGRAPEPDELAAKLGTEAREVAAGLAGLARSRHLALGDQGQIVMAHPFSAVPLGFSVMGARTLWWAAAPGAPSRCPTCCARRARCWWRPGARRAVARTRGEIADICTPH